MRKLVFAAVLALLSVATSAQPAGWNDPFPPHHIMDNVYYVGTTMLSSYLIATPEGLILMNSNYEASWPVIKAGIEELGFDVKNIKILISGHAHPDHIEGDALVKEITGAEVVVGRLEVPAVKAFKHPAGKTLPIDRIVDDGDTVTLGGTTLTAHVLPGHTKGCLAWSMNLEEAGKTYYALVECSLNGGFLKYVNNADYPNIVEDMRSSYQKARELPVEVFLSSHAVFYGMAEKYAKLLERKPGDPNPFVDPDGYQAHVDEFEKVFEDTLAKQQAEAQAAVKENK
jgi:metallo-beta-lactamase class B